MKNTIITWRGFWCKRGILNYLLLPFSWLYWLVHLCNYYIFQHPKKVSIPVICIGNITVGGSGKTPTCIALARYIIDVHKKKVAFILRGYKGALSSSHRVVKVYEDDSAEQVGDEALLLAAVAPTFICVDRYKAAIAAQRDGAEIIIMDDGLQNNTIHKDFSCLLIDGHYKFGNGFILPAGPLREPVWLGRKKIDISIVVDGDQGYNPFLRLEHMHAYSFCANIAELKAHDSILVTAIARGERVLKMLQNKGVCIKKHYQYKDHHIFTKQELLQIVQYAQEYNLSIVTTEKDFVKIQPTFRKYFAVIEFAMHFSEIAPLEAKIKPLFL